MRYEPTFWYVKFESIFHAVGEKGCEQWASEKRTKFAKLYWASFFAWLNFDVAI